MSIKIFKKCFVSVTTIIFLLGLSTIVNAGELSGNVELRILFGSGEPRIFIGLNTQYLEAINEESKAIVGKSVVNSELLESNFNGRFDVYDADGTIDTITITTSYADRFAGGRIGIGIGIRYKDGLSFEKPTIESKALYADADKDFEAGFGLGWDFQQSSITIPLHVSSQNAVLGTNIIHPIKDIYGGYNFSSELKVEVSSSSLTVRKLINPKHLPDVQAYLDRKTGIVYVL